MSVTPPANNVILDETKNDWAARIAQLAEDRRFQKAEREPEMAEEEKVLELLSFLMEVIGVDSSKPEDYDLWSLVNFQHPRNPETPNTAQSVAVPSAMARPSQLQTSRAASNSAISTTANLTRNLIMEVVIPIPPPGRLYVCYVSVS